MMLIGEIMMSNNLTQRFENALQYAARLHSAQVRKGTKIPYISHLLAVTSIVMENGGNEDEVIAGLLHDAVEDQGGAKTFEEIRQLFGEKVGEIVAGCTDAWIEPKPPWRERKENYISHLCEVSPSVLLVSSADKLHNARTILADYRKSGEDVWLRFKGSKEGVLWYYRELTNTYMKLKANSEIIDELHRVVSELERLTKKTIIKSNE